MNRELLDRSAPAKAARAGFTPLRILQVSPYYYPAWSHGGPISCIHALCRGLCALGHQVEVFTTVSNSRRNLDVPPNRPIDVEGVTVRYFERWGKSKFQFSPRLDRACREHADRFDVAHLNTMFVYPTAAAARAFQRAGLPYVVSPHGMLDTAHSLRQRGLKKRLYLDLVEHRTLRHAARIHYTAEDERRTSHQPPFDTVPAVVVPNPIDLAELGDPADPPPRPSVWDVGPGTLRVLFLSRIDPKKCLDIVIDAAMRLLTAGLGFRLVIAGDGLPEYEAKMRRHAAMLPDAAVRFVGQVDGAIKLGLLHHADVLVLPSRHENFGMVVAEALACGKPVVISPQVAIAPELGDCALVVPRTPEAVAAALMRLAADPEGRRQMGRRARVHVERHYEMLRVAEAMTEVYREVVRERTTKSQGNRGSDKISK